MSTAKKTTKKTKKEPKPMPLCRIFIGGDVYHEAYYDEKTKTMIPKYHNDELTEHFEEMLTRRLTEAAKTIVAENPDTGLLKL